MAYRKYYRTNRKPTERTITVKYAGKCICCGGTIEAGEAATYWPAGSRYPDRGVLEHVAGAWDEGERVSLKCAAVLRAKHQDGAPGSFENPKPYTPEAFDRSFKAVNAYAGDGLDERYEDQCRDVCGL